MLTDYSAFNNTDFLKFTPYAVNGQDILGLCEFKRTAEAHFVFPSPLLIYIHAGEKIISINGTDCRLKAGSGILIPPRSLFNCEVLWADEKLVCINVLLTQEMLSEFSQFLEQEHLTWDMGTSPVIIDNPFIQSYFDTLIPLIHHGSFPHRLLDLKMFELLVLLKSFSNEPLMTSGRTHQTRNVSICNVVSNHLVDNISLNELAIKSGTSVATFKREFRHLFNSSARQWIVQQRLQKASRMLRYTDQSIKQISFSCGFNDPSYFIKSFKRAFGNTPEAFRSVR